ncbi:MAG: periplasmic heavy metal sensor [Archangiaceae bacterium]|nr:periplasmic heavy metal sensor [Archangiaceae bacterium]
MFGFIFGTVCLVALVKVVKHGHHWGHGGGWGRGDGPKRWMLRRLFQRLDTTPGQEKVISEAYDELQEKLRAVREELQRARGTFARATRAEAFDTESVREQFEKQQGALEELKKAALASMQKIHEGAHPRAARGGGRADRVRPAALRRRRLPPPLRRPSPPPPRVRRPSPGREPLNLNLKLQHQGETP